MKGNKKKLQQWIESLGYSLDNNYYGPITKMSYNPPSYKVMADIVLASIKKSNPLLTPYKAWQYTTEFVNGMKSNLIKNNLFFQKVLTDGLNNFETKKQERDIILFSRDIFNRNDYNFIKNIWIKNDKEKSKYDYVLMINGLPLVLIQVLDKKTFNF